MDYKDMDFLDSVKSGGDAFALTKNQVIQEEALAVKAAAEELGVKVEISIEQDFVPKVLYRISGEVKRQSGPISLESIATESFILRDMSFRNYYPSIKAYREDRDKAIAKAKKNLEK